MRGDFPSDETELTQLLVIEDLPYDWGSEVGCFFRDPDDHLFEISSVS